MSGVVRRPDPPAPPPPSPAALDYAALDPQRLMRKMFAIRDAITMYEQGRSDEMGLSAEETLAGIKHHLADLGVIETVEVPGIADYDPAEGAWEAENDPENGPQG